MKIPASSTPLQSLNVTRVSGDVRHWQPGQHVQATVLANVTKGLVNLRIGTTILTAQLEASLRAGDKLLLEVLSVGDKPVLRGVRTDSVQQLLESALRQALPKQASHAQLLSDIKALLQQQQLPPLPDKVQQALRQLYDSFVERKIVSTPNGVQQALRQSGLFLEAQLAGRNIPGISISADLKAGLLRLQQALQQQMPQAPTAPAQQPVNPARAYAPPGQNPMAAATTAPLPTLRTATFAPFTYQAPDTGQLQQGQLRPVLIVQGDTRAGVNLNPAQLSANVATDNARTSLATPTRLTNPLASTPNPTTNVGVTADTTTSTTTRLPTPGAEAIGRAVVASQTLNRGTTPGVLGQTIAGLPGTPGIKADGTHAGTTQMPFIYTGHPPFRLNYEADTSRPSARFSRLDNLTKILALFLKDADSSLARIQMNQLTQHTVDTEQKQSWLFEIPVRHKDSLDLFQFRIERDGKNAQDDADEENTGWTVHIAFNLEVLGQIHSKVNIHQKQVSIIFWTEEQQTTAAFVEHLQTLQRELEDAGLVVTHLNCIQGKPPVTDGTPLQSGVVDEEA